MFFQKLPSKGRLTKMYSEDEQPIHRTRTMSKCALNKILRTLESQISSPIAHPCLLSFAKLYAKYIFILTLLLLVFKGIKITYKDISWQHKFQNLNLHVLSYYKMICVLHTGVCVAQQLGCYFFKHSHLCSVFFKLLRFFWIMWSANYSKQIIASLYHPYIVVKVEKLYSVTSSPPIPP